MKIHKTLMAFGLTAGLAHGEAKAQFPHGPYLAFEAKMAAPVNQSYSSIYKTGMGGTLKVGAQVGDFSFITFSADYITNGVKPEPLKTGLFKSKDAFTLQTGLRYNFTKEEATGGAFFMEPQIGWTMVGKDYNTVSLTPTVGYTFSGKLDLSLWFRSTTSQVVSAKMSMLGVGVAYNLFFSGSGDD
ncbi:MAG: hypothetical protein ACO1NW_15980 [Chitinophagaceae bacterium]